MKTFRLLSFFILLALGQDSAWSQFGFQGHFQDNDATNFLRARNYDPETGAFILRTTAP